MTPPAETTTPPATQAAILEAVVRLAHPRYELPSIASHYSMTLVELQAILKRHGYPDKTLMARARAALLSDFPNLATSEDHGVRVVDAKATGGRITNPVGPEPDPPGFVVPGPRLTRLDANHILVEPGDADEDYETEDTGQLTKVPVTALYPDPDNPREELTGIEELADSIKVAGLLQPILARNHNGKLYVIAGHRRLAAVKRLRWSEVDVIIRQRFRPDRVLAAMLIENGQRKDLDPIEEARAMARLRDERGLGSHQAIGALIGRNQVYVSGRLALLALSAEDQAAVRRGEMQLREAVDRGRLNSGRVKAKGQDKNWHFGPTHQLADRARARCTRLVHPKGRKLGGIACGECLESVIRADEREHINEVTNKTGTCVICHTDIEKELSK